MDDMARVIHLHLFFQSAFPLTL